MIHDISLSDIPVDFLVPEELTERFWYDAGRGRLCFDGFMSKCMYDRLVTLSRDEKYQRALEELFRICVPDELARSPAQKVKVAVAALAGLAAVGGFAVWILAVR